MNRYADIIERAADIMQNRGKCEGIREDGAGRVCALGALQVALGLAPYHRGDNPRVLGPGRCILPSRFETLEGEHLGPERVIDIEGLERMMRSGATVNILGLDYRILGIDIETGLVFRVKLKLGANL